MCSTLHCIDPPALEALPYFEQALGVARPPEGTILLEDAPLWMHRRYALEVQEAGVCAGV